MEIKIDMAKLNDLPVILELFLESICFHKKYLPEIFQLPSTKKQIESYIMELIRNNNSEIFVAIVDKEITGMIIAIIVWTPAIPVFLPRKYGRLDDMIVKENFRKKRDRKSPDEGS